MKVNGIYITFSNDLIKLINNDKIDIKEIPYKMKILKYIEDNNKKIERKNDINDKVKVYNVLYCNI